jgi:VanZ family protein
VTPVPGTPLSRRRFAAFAAGFALFTIYGSLVPFEFVPRTWDNAVAAFAGVFQKRLWPESRSDFAANFLLGLPLGLCLIGALRFGRKGVAGSFLAAAALVPINAVFATAIEFSQLWFPARTCAGSDVLAQILGSSTGMALWVVAGPALTGFASRIWDAPNRGGRAGRALFVYGLGLVAIQTLPWDITASPVDWYRKVRDHATVVPFAEVTDRTVPPEIRAKKPRDWAELTVLFAPAGLLMAGLTGPFRRAGGFAVVALAGLALGAVTEAAQIPILSRHPSATDIAIEAAAVLTGWAVGRAVTAGGLPVVVPTVSWVALLAVVNWWPWDARPGLMAERLAHLSLLPFLSLESKNYLYWLEEVAVKAAAFAPVGAAMARSGTKRAVAVAMAVAVILEFGQLFVPERYPGLTDVVLAGLGGGVGAAVANAVAPAVETFPLEPAT